MSVISFRERTRTRKKKKNVEELYVCSAKEILPSEGGKKLSNQFIIN